MNIQKRKIELLAPARNLECGIEAINHGADAVYIGAPKFGARSAAGNSLADIATLVEYAHLFNVRIYVTVNTILKDSELSETEEMIWQLYNAGVDALIVQDMGITQLNLPPIPLHASTQMDNRTVEKVRFLSNAGFRQVVLARELSLDEIRKIHEACPDVALEVFVHGALCVSYSGQCYVSEACFGRSANRGECAQFCRLPFSMVDEDGKVIVRNKHLLSLKDLNQSSILESLLDAGATSLKIEGRLKDVTYVKNVTAAYSRRLDGIVKRHPDKYCRASFGKCSYTFTPSLDKTFNRGFTDYFLKGRESSIISFDTPKSIGEYVGKVKDVHNNSFSIAGTASFANGDGLCFVNGKRELEGFRVNRADGNKIYPLKMPRGLCRGMEIYRNNDHAFEKLLARKSAERKIPLAMCLEATDEGFRLEVSVEGVMAVHDDVVLDKQEAKTPQRDNIVRQLTKLGNTPYECRDVKLLPVGFNYFIPSSVLAGMRRRVVDKLHDVPLVRKRQETDRPCEDVRSVRLLCNDKYYNYNISNRLARNFYVREGKGGLPEAYEISMPKGALLMQCRHCIRFSLGRCVKYGGQKPEWRAPLFLRLPDGRRFRLEFDCMECKMNVYADD